MNLRLLSIGIGKRYLRHKFKSLLMALGIVIGVMALISSITLGAGLKNSILKNLNNSFMPNNIGLSSSGNSINDRQLTLNDISVVNNSVTGLSLWTPLISGGRKTINVPGSDHRSVITGVDVSAQIVMGQPAVEGEYFNQMDVQRRNRVVLIGQTLKQGLFPDQSALGQQLTIDSRIFTVKGILKSLGSDPHGGDLDNVVLLPYTTLMQMTKSEQIGNVRFMVDNPQASTGIAEAIGVIMRQQHNIAKVETDDFLISTSPRGIDMIERMDSMFKLLIPIVVGIIFLIAAIVIAVIMQISIRQRTAEIGLRKALGARPIDLENQFLAETTIVGCVGAIVGILLTLPLLRYAEIFYAGIGGEISLQPSLPVIGLGFLCAVVAGLVAGYFPARKAAALVPVEALR